MRSFIFLAPRTGDSEVLSDLFIIIMFLIMKAVLDDKCSKEKQNLCSKNQPCLVENIRRHSEGLRHLDFCLNKYYVYFFRYLIAR